MQYSGNSFQYLHLSVQVSSGHKVDLQATDTVQTYTVDSFVLGSMNVFLGQRDYIVVITARDQYQVGQLITVDVRKLTFVLTS